MNNLLKSLPQNLVEEKQFLFWGKSESSGSDRAPIIFEPNVKTFFCKTSDIMSGGKFDKSKHLLTLDNALEILNNKDKCKQWKCKVKGVGYWLEGGKYSFIDIDNAFIDDSEVLREYFECIVSDFYDSYIEYSPSKRGLHILLNRESNLSSISIKLNQLTNVDIDTSTGKEPGIDYYGNQTRFVTLTGKLYSETKNINFSDTDFKSYHNTFYNIKNPKRETKERTRDYINGNENLDYILNNCDIHQVLGDFMGYSYSGKKDMCPFHNGNSPSFQEFKKDSNKFICYSSDCQAGISNKSGQRLIDCIDVVKFARSCNTYEAMQMLRDKYFPTYQFNHESKEDYSKYFDVVEDKGNQSTSDKEERRGDMLDYLDKFISHIEVNQNYKVIESGFPRLDEKLHIYPGLYTLGAISALGKTTLALQIADNIASNNIPVLFFSLEMGLDELIAKSLSRILYKKFDLSRGYFNILYKGLGYEPDKFKESFSFYKNNIAPNLKVIPGNFEMTIDDIIKHIDSYIESSPVKPVIFVDYLQVIKASKAARYCTEKEKIDNIVTTLKQLSIKHNVPIFVVSSFNRDNYKVPVSFASFKESGGIEYTSDVVLGLQLSILDDKEDDKKVSSNKLQEAKDKNNIDISLVILKNRGGKCGKHKFAFNKRENTFVEKDILFTEEFNIGEKVFVS